MAGFFNFFDRRARMRSEAEQLRYLPQSVKLEEAINPHIIRMTMLLISAAVLAFVVWASQTPIKEVTAAQGEVVPKGFVQVVQHLDGGIVTEILANEGDLVEQGSPLVRIDDGRTTQDLAEALAKQRFLSIEAERLRAFIANKKPNYKQFEVQGEQPGVKKVSSSTREMREMYAYSAKLGKNLRLAKEALRLQAKLHRQGHASKLTLLKHQKEVNKMETEAHREFSRIEAQLAQNKEVITKLKNKMNRLEVRSPVYGLVKGLEVNTVGGVIEPGKTLMEIVPLDERLVVEARISPKDIGHTKVGQPVNVKVSSYDFSRYGTVEGQLESLSATTFLDLQGEPYYRAQVVLSQNYVGDNPQANVILPGMTVEADVVTGDKTILSYLLKPIHLSLQTAFTER